ncbi:MAG: SprT family zinc-dependent metalloprotease [Tissierellaceae bacterium]|nr:SprT family zinc-dependent metalloprotease [Tissierellaceae bacterium]
MKIDFEDFSIDCNVQYGKRKRMMISIDPTGFVTIKAPNNTPEEKIIEAVKPLGKKLKKKLEELEALRSKFSPKTYDGEGKFLYLGKEYPLDELIDIDGLNEEEQREYLKKFYISNCKRIICERIKIYQDQVRLNPKEYKIDESKSRWGSCSSERKLTFNYRLAMAPMECIDYVVVHELCHLQHMNHDRSFWRLVGSILPDYKERQEYLKKYGQFLTL